MPGEPNQLLRARPAPWGRFTPLRSFLVQRIAGAMALPARDPEFACTIVKLDRIGDFVLAIGAIRRLVAHFGPARSALVVSHEVQALAAREFPGVRSIALPAAATRLFREIAPYHGVWRRSLAAVSAEHVVCLRHQRSLYRDLVLRAIPAAHRWWLNQVPFSDPELLGLGNAAARYPSSRSLGEPSELVAHSLLLTKILDETIPTAEIMPRLLSPLDSTRRAAVVVAPLAHHRIRDLPMSSVWAAIENTSKLLRDAIVLIGSSSQAARLAAIREAAPPSIRDRCKVRAGESLDEWLRLIGSARVVVAAESASAHVATAMDRPLVAVLGGGHPSVCAPWSRSLRQQWLQHLLPCYGCEWICHHPEPFCLTRISSDRMIRALNLATQQP